MRRYLPHRMTVVVIGVMLVAVIAAFGTARSVVEDNESRLLNDRAQDVRGLLESLGTSYGARMASVAAVAQVTGGDLGQFRVAVDAVDELAATADSGGWGLLHRTPLGFEQVGAVGAPTSVDAFPAEWVDALADAARGRFAVLGFVGEGFDRRFAMASGRTGVPGDYVVYNETSLLGATSQAASGDASVISGLAVALHVGDRPDPDKLLLAIGEPRGRVQRLLVDISGTEILLQVGTTEPLAGELATNLPRILLAAGLLLGLALAGLVELTLRRRDDALGTVADLERKNVQLDLALEEQRAAEEARTSLEGELRQSHRLEAVGQLAGGVAHDFNNLLAAIISYADLAGDGVTDEQARDDLDEITRAARRGVALTSQLLQFSRREPVEPVVVDVNERVRDLTKMLTRTLGEDVSLRASLTDQLASVRADPHGLDQVLLNLIVNARDALAPGGSIVVETDRVTLDERFTHQYPGLDPGDHVRIVVRDDGCGIEPAVIEHVFEPFFTTKGRGEGTGLGLATVYGIIRRHNGHVAVRSTPGEGTEIEVLLRATDEVAVPDSEPNPVAPTAGGLDRTVLVVEDEAPVRRAIRRMLERFGYTVLESEDGATAVERHAGAEIDLLLTDLVMPGSLTGVDVARLFRDRWPALPVLFITGYGASVLDGRGLAEEPGMSMLAKPFSEDALLEAVRVALPAG